MGEKPSLAIIASDNDQRPSSLPSLLSPAYPSDRPQAPFFSTSAMSEIRRKLVIVGDGACGKVGRPAPSPISNQPRPHT